MQLTWLIFLLSQDSQNDTFLQLVGVCSLVPKDWLLGILYFLYGNYAPPFICIFILWCSTFEFIIWTPWINYLGMKKISFFWVYAVPQDHKLWCPLLFCQVIACTLDSLLLQLMLLQRIAVSQCSTTPGSEIFFPFAAVIAVLQFSLAHLETISLYKIIPGLAHQSLSSLWQNMLKLYFIPVFQ